MRHLELPATYNCNLRCSYCINHVTGKAKKRKFLSGDQWLVAINRLELRPDLPVTLQGGEPSTHPDFFRIIAGIRPDIKLDILTNLQFDPHRFMEAIAPERLARDAPYAPIRVSFHPETMKLEPLLEKVGILAKNGYDIGVYGVLHPHYRSEIEAAQIRALSLGIDFRTKEFLGELEGEVHGTYQYSGAVAGKVLKSCLCKTTELLISPSGDVHRCHHDLYNDLLPLGSLLDDGFAIRDEFRSCSYFGNCNPCDVKVKTNRFQKHGHTSVVIKDISEHVAEGITAQGSN